jgi:uncharacterized repeat protein (TIGR04138 family)
MPGFETEVGVDARILEAVKEDDRYAYEAYEFVCDAVKFTQDRLGLGQDGSDDETDNHVGAADLLRGCCEMAIRDFGMMAPVVFEHWCIRATDDIGNIVFNLIHIDRLKSSDRDDPDDFRDAFDLNRALTDGFELTVVPAGSRKAAER